MVDEEGGENEEWEKEIDQMLEDEVEENTKLMDWWTMFGKLDAAITCCYYNRALATGSLTDMLQVNSNTVGVTNLQNDAES